MHKLMDGNKHKCRQTKRYKRQGNIEAWQISGVHLKIS